MDKKKRRRLKLTTRLILGISFLLVICFSTYTVSVNTIINSMVYSYSSAQDIVFTVIITAALILGVFLIMIAIFVVAMIKNTVKCAVLSFEEKSLALESGKTIEFDSTTLDDSFGLDQMSITFNRILDIISRLIADISTMHELHEQGSYKETIDCSSYEGGYKTIATGINEMVERHTNSKAEILTCITSIVNGDFGASIYQYSGDEAYINDSIEGLRANIRNIAESINSVAINAQKGNVDFYVDPDMYKGEWVNIIRELNGILTAIRKPLKETTAILTALQQGNFNERVHGDFPGEFSVIKNAINTTCESISSYIEEINTVLLSLANGDLSHKIDRPYVGQFTSIKDSINNISETLVKVISEINSASQHVLDGAKRIASDAMELADGSQAQASSLEELNTSVELINLQTHQFADNAREANTLSNKSTNNAQEGNMAMKQMLIAMEGIMQSSHNISKIIRAIQDIAFQTNLLALNAAVEAARAGEHGKGFAVVAEEVRGLAAKSRDAATETTNLINDSITRVESGSSIAHVTSESLDTIVHNVKEVLTLINNISNAANEQATMIAQISSVLLTTATTVQNNSRFAQNAASTAEELSSQSEKLQQMVAYFKF